MIASILVSVSVALAIVSSIGLGIAKEAFERLHFSSAVTSFSAGLIVVAVWLDDPDWQSRLKVILVAVILFVMNSVLSHATARAIRIREAKHLQPEPIDKIPLITRENPTGLSK
ncbi:MAG TPA: monovalent cation/H(+) antiporter subunit G [Candidatus Acidoferrales bacterium]|nr:monovalent cation/H(+) antiporter subunit G [Candidatus Acidoferrales bacterium]